MKDLKEIIKELFLEEKMSAKYQLQLNKVVEAEDKFTKGFSRSKWLEYFNLDLIKGELHLLEIEQIIEFVVSFMQNLNIRH